MTKEAQMPNDKCGLRPPDFGFVIRISFVIRHPSLPVRDDATVGANK
jgi:hypothetical protein